MQNKQLQRILTLGTPTVLFYAQKLNINVCPQQGLPYSNPVRPGGVKASYYLTLH